MKAPKNYFHPLAVFGLLLSASLVTNCSGQTLESTETAVRDSDVLTIWWEQGYYTQEDEAIEIAIEKWQKKTGNQVQLSFIDQDTIRKETENALKAGNPPDLLYSHRTEETLTSLWAKQGKLADVSEVVGSLQEIYSPEALASVDLYNDKQQKYSTYAVPLNQKTVYIHYSKVLLDKAGFSETDIPKDWDAFWAFWQQAQDNLRAQGNSETYGLGLPMSSEGHDTYNAFEQVLEAYDVNILNEEGTLQLNEPQVKQGIIAALEWYTNFYQNGYVPPTAIDWRNRDNNISFLNQELLMVVNPTLSIPGSQREDEDIYKNQIATIEFPNEPDGESPRYRVSIQQVIVFETSLHKKMAKDFLTYLMQPENIAPYLEGTLGRFFPVMPQLTSDPFWNDPTDPHISTATQQFKAGKTLLQGHHLNPAYGVVQGENIWGQAIEKILVDNISPEAAAIEAINRIEEIFSVWEK